MSQTRQLAAIMFTDIVGYTALMGNDEDRAFQLLAQNRHIHKPLIDKYNGRWIKEIGDSVLASFTTVYDAVVCAGDIQRATSHIPGLQLRVGIHLGDIIFENNDVFGDGVNIASRLQTICSAGGICISESVYNSITNKKGVTAKFLREETLKNVKDPVRIYEVTVVVEEATAFLGDPASHPEIDGKITSSAPGKSVAVLPFVNMSNDPEQEYFSDGIAEEILNSLSHIKDLKIAGRTSSFQFKGRNVDVREVGEKLNVRTVMEGSVRKQGTRLRITAQLINVEDGFHLWSERYDRDMDDIFAIQDEIALAITEKLKITLLESEKVTIQTNPTDNHEAYDLYLKGRFHWNKRGIGIRKALQFFQQAVEIDPNFPLAYTGMADVYCILALYCSVPPQHGMPKAKEYAEKALQSNASLVEAQTALAFIATFYDWDWSEARRRFKLIFELNANYAPAHYWYSYYLSFVELKFEEAIHESLEAEILEPLTPAPPHVASMMYYNAGKFDEGIKASRNSIELDANFFPGYRTLGLNLVGKKELEQAAEALEMAATVGQRHPIALVELCWIYSLMGRKEDAQKILDEFILRSATEYISPLYLGCVAYFSGNEDKAVVYIAKAFEQRESLFPCIKLFPLFYFFREDPRFQHYIELMKFPN